MGEVYRARDTKLNRDVALQAQALASFNYQDIGGQRRSEMRIIITACTVVMLLSSPISTQQAVPSASRDTVGRRRQREPYLRYGVASRAIRVELGLPRLLLHR